MSIFADTSALYALLDRSDAHHSTAAKLWTRLLSEDQAIATSNYVLVELCALAQNRLGMAAVQTIVHDMVPVLQVEWVGMEEHQEAVAGLLTAARRRLSLVDCASFVIMRRRGITEAFAFDSHFSEQGFHELR
jgi:uncharacterized protein